MTLHEFKIWVDGFTAGLSGPLDSAQKELLWKRIGEIDGAKPPNLTDYLRKPLMATAAVPTPFADYTVENKMAKP